MRPLGQRDSAENERPRIAGGFLLPDLPENSLLLLSSSPLLSRKNIPALYRLAQISQKNEGMPPE